CRISRYHRGSPPDTGLEGNRAVHTGRPNGLDGGGTARALSGFDKGISPNPPRRNPMSFSLPDLPYAYDALAPYMSRETLEYHHDKHHLAYVNNGNKLLKDSAFEGKTLEEVVKGSFGKNDGLFNNAGQHYNHIHFWQWMKAGGGGDK